MDAIRAKPLAPLTALTAAALSLPSLAEAQPVETTVSVGVANYREADVPRHRIVGGDAQRYDIDVRQFKLLTPVGRKWSLGLDISRETMSGASPWGTAAGPDGKPAAIMSGASIRDDREEMGVTVTRYDDDDSLALTVARSDEDDYEANAASVSGEWGFNDDLTTLSGGLSYSRDTVTPTDAALFGRVSKEKRKSRSVSAGLSQVLGRSSVIFAGLSVTEHSGYLSDPYKLRDVRPRDRREWALGVRYRRFLEESDASLHLDYRHYTDSWHVNSHTLHASWYQNLGAVFQLVPNVRYYSQSEADFYRAVDDFALPPERSQSSDFRLSSYGAVTLGLKSIAHLPTWSVAISVDRYAASGKYGLESGHRHPAEISFTLASITFDFRF